MFYEENYTYERIDKSDYEKLIDLYEGELEIMIPKQLINNI